MNRIVNHLHHNLVAYVALFVALGGTSYAAVSIRNHSINPIKLNRKYIGGYIRAWASVNADGRLVAGSPGAEAIANDPGSGLYAVLWSGQRFSGCFAQAGFRVVPGGPPPGIVYASMTSVSARRGEVIVATTSQQQQAMSLPFNVSVVCPTP